MSYRRTALAIIVVFSSLAIVSNNANDNSNGERFDIATVASAAVVGQGKLAVRCKNAMTQPEINACAQEYFKRADAELNRVYKRLVSQLSSPNYREEDQSNLTEAQRAWLKYRDANCLAERELYHGGSIAPTIEAGCLERVTIARTKELNSIYAQRHH